MVSVFANGPGDMGSIPGWVIPRTLKKSYSLHHKVWIKGKVEQSWERGSALSLHLGVLAIEKGAFVLPSTTVPNICF